MLLQLASRPSPPTYTPFLVGGSGRSTHQKLYDPSHPLRSGSGPGAVGAETRSGVFVACKTREQAASKQQQRHRHSAGGLFGDGDERPS